MKNRPGSCRLHWPTGDEIAGLTQSLCRFFDPVGVVPLVKLDVQVSRIQLSDWIER